MIAYLSKNFSKDLINFILKFVFTITLNLLLIKLMWYWLPIVLLCTKKQECQWVKFKVKNNNL